VDSESAEHRDRIPGGAPSAPHGQKAQTKHIVLIALHTRDPELQLLVFQSQVK